MGKSKSWRERRFSAKFFNDKKNGGGGSLTGVREEGEDGLIWPAFIAVGIMVIVAKLLAETEVMDGDFGQLKFRARLRPEPAFRFPAFGTGRNQIA
ncbi:MAG TPA: hypothetical protein VFV23_01450 [Verrucomicrobiae bacterium]|nr:hypothetical protein [Verrucomicrobiae bacterium]